MGLNHHALVNSYTITIPVFTRIVVARSKKEALEQFWFDYDCAQEDPDWQRPVVESNERTKGAL